MRIKELKRLSNRATTKATLVEPACGAMVIKIDYQKGNELSCALLKTKHGKVVTLKHLAQGYALLRKAGLHQAWLEQIVPHAEICINNPAVNWASNPSSNRALIPLKF